MVPYLDIPPLKFGPLEFNIFGVLIVIGILVGSLVAKERAKEYHLEKSLVSSAIAWVLVAAFIGAHLIEVLAYRPNRLLTDLWLLLNIFDGISSFGGFLGGLLGLALFARHYQQPLAIYTDIISLGLIPGWIISRFGCYLVHDHPGIRSEFFLAVAYPGGSRHDLGLYEMLLTIVLFGIFEWIRRQSLAPGSVALLIGLFYSPVRFFLDFLRINDVRYFFFTPGQFGSVLLFTFCLVLYLRQQRRTGKKANNI